jgi:hypothetical protein
MGAVYVSLGCRLPPRSVSVFGQPSSIRPELTGIAMVLKDCPDEEDLNILTDSLSAIVLLRSMQRKDLPLWLYQHTARQLLLSLSIGVRRWDAPRAPSRSRLKAVSR